MTTFNWWTIVGPALLVLSILMGYFSVRREDCAVYVCDISAGTVLMSLSASLLFVIMVMTESYLGIVDFVLRHFIAAGESEAWADVAAAGILLGTFIAYAVVFGLLCCLSADLHERYLRKRAKAVKHDHYNARQDPVKLAELREKCSRASCGHCPVGLDKIGRELTTVTDPEAGTTTAIIDEPVNVGAIAEPVDDESWYTPTINVTDDDAKEQLQQIFARQRAQGKTQICVLELPCEVEARCEIIDLRPQTEKIG